MNTTTRQLAATLVAVALGVAAAPVFAQEKVLRENQVTQKKLLEALTPPAAAASAADDGVRTRSFKAAVRPAAVAGGTAAAAAAAGGPGRASILVTFITDSAELTARAKGALDVLAAAMKSPTLATVNFTIEGHADPRGGDDINLKLSQARADSVREYLVARHGMAAERLNTLGKGSSELLNPKQPAAAENRRVTIVSRAQ